ncbi:MAG: aminotransferase [Solibacterales bacterium]|nr:aminotransferase [Bryobacterales bacterium]
MFSSRTAWNRLPNRLTVALQSLQARGFPVIDLTMSNPTLCEFNYSETTQSAWIDPITTPYEPSALGTLHARNAVSSYYSKRGFTVSPKHIVLTPGTSNAYSHLFQLLTDPGDEVVTAAPGYPLLEFLVDLHDVRLVRYPLLYDGIWRLNIDALKRVLTKRSRVLVIVSPNNPTGSFLKTDELEEVVDLCRRRNLALVIDEVFFDFSWSDDSSRAPSGVTVTDCLTFTLNGLSKTAALPQVKLGWIAANGPQTLLSESLSRLEIIADTYLSVGASVQSTAPFLIEQGDAIRPEILNRIQTNCELLDSVFTEDCLCSRLRTEGGWYGVLRIPSVLDDESYALHLLENYNVFVHPGSFYDFPFGDYLVLSLITPTEVLVSGLEKLQTDQLFQASSEPI